MATLATITCVIVFAEPGHVQFVLTRQAYIRLIKVKS